MPRGQQLVHIDRARLSDIAPIFNLIQEGSRIGSFSNLDLDSRYQAGLALQLFSVYLFGKIRLPDRAYSKRSWKPCATTAALPDSCSSVIICRRAGDLHVRGPSRISRPGTGPQAGAECARGFTGGCIVEADCLPDATSMKNLLRDIGFQPVNAQTGRPSPPTVIVMAAEPFLSNPAWHCRQPADVRKRYLSPRKRASKDNAFGSAAPLAVLSKIHHAACPAPWRLARFDASRARYSSEYTE